MGANSGRQPQRRCVEFFSMLQQLSECFSMFQHVSAGFSRLQHASATFSNNDLVIQHLSVTVSRCQQLSAALPKRKPITWPRAIESKK
jgi:hypothetical protein